MHLIEAIDSLWKGGKVSHHEIHETAYLFFDGEKILSGILNEEPIEISLYNFLYMMRDVEEDGWYLFDEKT